MTIAEVQKVAGQVGLIALHHGTDLVSAADIEKNGLNVAKAHALGGSGDFWASDDMNEANWFARVNPAGGQAARFDFSLPANVLLQLLTSNQAQLHPNDGIEFFATSFMMLNANKSHKQVVLVP